MKGLLLKDCQLTLMNRQMVIVMVIMVPILLVTGGDNMTSFAMFYLGFMSAMMVLSTITYDDMEHGMTFLMTLPVNRKTYVAEKYTFGGIMIFVGMFFAQLVITIYQLNAKGEVAFPQNLIETGVGIFTIAIVLAIMIPLQLKFGADKGRIVIIGCAAGIMVLVYGSVWIMKKLNLNIDGVAAKIDAVIENISGYMAAGILILVLAVVYGISIAVSNHIMRKKEL